MKTTYRKSTKHIDQICFFNSGGVGDLHLGRAFIHWIKEHSKIACSYFHKKSFSILADLDIEQRNIDAMPEFNPTFFGHDERGYYIRNSTVYINTWVGAYDKHFLRYGTTVDTLLRILQKTCNEVLNIKLGEASKYVPVVNYNHPSWSELRRKLHAFLESHKGDFLVLVANGPVYSGQRREIAYWKLLHALLSRGAVPIATDRQGTIEGVTTTADIFGDCESDIMQISELSTRCNAIVGSASGPYACSLVKENLIRGVPFINISRKQPDLPDFGLGKYFPSMNKTHVLDDDNWLTNVLRGFDEIPNLPKE